jgi:hypothetical protein
MKLIVITFYFDDGNCLNEKKYICARLYVVSESVSVFMWNERVSSCGQLYSLTPGLANVFQIKFADLNKVHISSYTNLHKVIRL